MEDCRLDLLFSGNPRTASLHLQHLKEDCLEELFSSTSSSVEDEGGNIIEGSVQTAGANINGGFRKLNSDVRRGRGVSLLRPPTATPTATGLQEKRPTSIATSLCLNDCSLNGNCGNSGTCECFGGFYGSDCSVEIRNDGSSRSRVTIPKVTSLANYGLCDVRAKPCRDIVVLGDNFVNYPGLTCIYETYKIRGVASKQLVKDPVETTARATFLAHGQVMCPLPEFDIHKAGMSSEDAILNIDFEDNTDHTRMFVKLSLAYVLPDANNEEESDNKQNPLPPPSSRSWPLDLLLYDSLCWDCESSGQCRVRTRSKNQKTKNLCFFATARSTVQVFRIGKTISTRISKDDFKTCTLPKDSGGCDNKIFRYYYNAIEVIMTN